jgi:hypothetical protein
MWPIWEIGENTGIWRRKYRDLVEKIQGFGGWKGARKLYSTDHLLYSTDRGRHARNMLEAHAQTFVASDELLLPILTNN